MTEAQAQRLVERILTLGKTTAGASVYVALSGGRRAFTRFAAGQITTSAQVDELVIEVTIQIGKRSASAKTNQLDDRSIDELVGRARRMALLAPEDPETMPPLGRQTYAKVAGAVDAKTAAFTAGDRATAIAGALAQATAAKVQLAGFYEHANSFVAIANSAGLSARHDYTACGFSCTARTPDGTGSGWAGAKSFRVGDLDVGAFAKTAIAKASASAKPRRLEAGKYTVVLEAEATAGLLGALTGAFDARRADEGRSFFTGKKVGDKLFPDFITLRTRPDDPVMAVAPFDDDGMARAPLAWIDKGKLGALRDSRFWADKQKRKPLAAADGFQLDGGSATRDELIKGVERGVLVTRFWYLRSLDPQTLMMTGLTRDGTFLIEKGAIVGPVNNFRFNESPAHLLANADALSATALVGDAEADRGRMPAVRAHDFNLASISEAV